MDFVMTNMIGHIICVRCKDGAIYEGILSAVNWTAGTKGLLLKQAKKILSRNDKAEKPKAEYTITREDFVSLATKADIDLYNDELTEAARRRGGGIEVDSEIEVSGGRAAYGTERDLVMASAWVGDGDGSLEGLSGGGGGVQRGWDQFAVNKQLGVTSSYSDELYTTKLSDKKFSAEQLRRAERLAKEIESGTTSNAHIAEERGQKELEEDDGDMDEEDKYSMVLAPGRKAGPPSTTPATPDVSDAKKADGGEAAPAAGGAPAADAPAPAAAAEAAPAASTTPGSRFGGSKLRAAAKEFVPGAAMAATPPPGGGTPGGTPTGPLHMAGYMGSPQAAVASGAMMQMGMQPMQYQNGGPMPMHGAGYMQQHPGMMAGHPQYQQQQQMAMAQQQQQQQFAAQQAQVQQQQQMAMAAHQHQMMQMRGQPMPVQGMPPHMMQMPQQGMAGMHQRGMSPGMAQGRGPQGYPQMMQQQPRGAYPPGAPPPGGFPQKGPAQQQPPPPPTPPQ